MPEREDSAGQGPATDLGAEIPEGGEDFGASEVLPEGRIHLQKVELEKLRQEAVRFDKEFQIKVLKLLLMTVLVLLVFDFAIIELGSKSTSYFQNMIAILMPVFTFLLGMGTQAPANSKK